MNQIVRKACSFLAQLPATAPDILGALPFSISSLAEYSIQPKSEVDSRTDNHWGTLVVAQHASNTLLRTALSLAAHILDSHPVRIGSGDFLDAIMELFKMSLQISSEEGVKDHKWLIVCVYLWTSWQRYLLLYLRYCMMGKLDGFDYASNHVLSMRGLRIIPEISSYTTQQQLKELQGTPYLCGWAFRTLRNDRACISMDLRGFHEAYRKCFGTRPPACNPGPTQCDGSSSNVCKRFKGSTIKNQSTHDQHCKGDCRRLFWDRESFIRVVGAKAVNIDASDANVLRYCKVTDRTLTISHVWSHGQGGRPDNVGTEGTGFNACLHRRYSTLATSFGYKSYWMDTPCIPSEKTLRWECISNITSIFSTSPKTVVCDRDIMTIDASSLTIGVYEHILAALLVCDWGIRAWTLLEAMRGRFALYLLCLNNQLVSVYEVVRSVCESGKLDIVTLFMTRSFLFPPIDLTDFELFDDGEKQLDTDLDREKALGFMSVGEAAVLLSHRHATRDTDDLLIWSLLIGDIEDASPVEMWRRQQGTNIRTGSLISSAKRIEGHQGLGWAPSRPTTLRLVNGVGSNDGGRFYLAYDGEDTAEGLITSDGLRARWLTYRFRSGGFSMPEKQMRSADAAFLGRMAGIGIRYLRRFNWGILLQTSPIRGPRTIPVPYRESEGDVVVVCGSKDGEGWSWRGIFGVAK